jgi:mono/diheme cytochrome c family protein
MTPFLRWKRVCRAAPLLAIATGVMACRPTPPPTPPDPISRGRDLFFNETFEGNGRTCGTCHRAEENFTLTAEFIAKLPADDPLFVAETNPALGQNFENPVLMRAFGLILENQDGFGDLANNFNQRGIPHTLGMRVSIASAAGPRTGWSGDGAPGDGSLRSFATGAVIQHFTKSTSRIAGVDFRLPTDQELDDLEAFQLSLGRQEELSLPLPLTGLIAARGQELFMDRASGKCNACHFNAGANGFFNDTATTAHRRESELQYGRRRSSGSTRGFDRRAHAAG